MASDGIARAEPTLRLLPSSIAESIRHTTDDHALRRFACACARWTLAVCRMEEALLLDALAIALTINAQEPDQIARLRREITERANLLDERAFAAQEAWDRGEGSRDAYASAFRTARAATCVLRTLDQSAMRAAAEACYEAFHSLDQSEAAVALLDIARREFER